MRLADRILVCASSATAREEDRPCMVVSEFHAGYQVSLPRMIQRNGNLVYVLSGSGAQTVIVLKVLCSQTDIGGRLERVFGIYSLAAPISASAGFGCC